MAKIIGISSLSKVIGVANPAKVMGVTFATPPATQTRAQGAMVYGGDNIAVTSAPFSSNISAGSLLVASISWRTNATTPTVGDTKGNTQIFIGQTYQPVTNVYFGMQYAVNTHGAGANTVTISYGAGATTGGAILEEFIPSSGVPTLDTWNGYGRGDFQTGTDTVYSNAFTTTVNGDLIYSTAMLWKSGGATPTFGTGFTGLQNIAPSYYCSFFRVASEYRIQATAGSIQGTFGFTEGGGSCAGNCIAASFKA